MAVQPNFWTNSLLAQLFRPSRQARGTRVAKPRLLNLETLKSRELMAGDIGNTDDGAKPDTSDTYSTPTSLVGPQAPEPTRTTGDVTGRVYFDENGDGKKQSTEHGIMGVRVKITGYEYEPKSMTPSRKIEYVTMTDEKGRFSFYDMPPGEYTITHDEATGLVSPTVRIGTEGGSAADDGIRVIVRAGVETLYNDFMYEKTANMESYGKDDLTPDPMPIDIDPGFHLASNKITGRVYFDLNGDGKKQDTEVGIGNVQIRLRPVYYISNAMYYADGINPSLRAFYGEAITITTDAQGRYTFENLAAGEYLIEQVGVEGLAGARLRVGTAGGSTADGAIKVSISGGKESMYNDFMYNAPLTDSDKNAELFAASAKAGLFAVVKPGESGHVWKVNGPEWKGYTDLKLSMAATGKAITVTATDPTGAKKSATITANLVGRVRYFKQTNGSYLVQLIGSPAQVFAKTTAATARSAQGASGEPGSRLLSAVDAAMSAYSSESSAQNAVNDLAETRAMTTSAASADQVFAS